MTKIDELFGQIAKVVLKKSDLKFSQAQTMIKQHTEKLSQMGDVGFPTTIQPWRSFLDNPSELNEIKQIISENDEEFVKKLIETSSEWVLPIKSVNIKQFRCSLFLDRPKCFRGILATVIEDTQYGQCHRSSNIKTIYAIDVNQLNDQSLIQHRCKLVASVLKNILRASGFEVSNKHGNAGQNGFNGNLVDVLVTGARTRQNDIELNNNASTRLIVCGRVNNESGYTADECIRRRSSDMEKMAESKHGYNSANDGDKCQKLGAAIVTFDLLKIKHYNPIDFTKLMKSTSIVKGAAFVLYNVARLQTLLATFDHQVERGFYQPLPDFHLIDFALLKEEEEWQMFYVYIVGFPPMLERCVSGIDNGHIAIHLLCTFLSNLSALFSVYYHRVKILTDNLPQLMPVLYARIYFLKALRNIFLKSLAILEIEPLDQM